MGAPRPEAATRRRRCSPTRVCRDGVQGSAAREVHARHRVQQTLGVGVVRRGEDLLDRPLLDDSAGVHHDDAVGDLGDHPQVVGDQQHADAVLAAEPTELDEDLRLDRDVESGSRLVGDDQPRSAGERDRDHDALAHATGELVRVGLSPARGPRDADSGHQLDGLVACGSAGHRAVHPQLLRDLGADALHRVEGRHRVLEDEPDPRTAHRAQVTLGGP